MSLRAIAYITDSETLDTTYDTFLIDATTATGATGLIFTLDDIQNDGENYWIKRIDTSSNIVTVQGFNSSQTIEGQPSITLNPGDRIIVISTDAGVWYYF